MNVLSFMSGRFAVFTYSCILALLIIILAISGSSPHPLWLFLAIIFTAIALVGVCDVLQRRHTILRNYPITGHFRFLLEQIRPEMR